MTTFFKPVNALNNTAKTVNNSLCMSVNTVNTANTMNISEPPDSS